MVILLDTFPASSVDKRPGREPSLLDQCREWIQACEDAGHRVLVPAISYYAALRELELRRAASRIVRLKAFCLQPKRFVPLTTAHLETAAEIWGQARRDGHPLAAPQALDCDVILAAQALSLGVSGLVVATTNPAHLGRLVAAEVWASIRP